MPSSLTNVLAKLDCQVEVDEIDEAEDLLNYDEMLQYIDDDNVEWQ